MTPNHPREIGNDQGDEEGENEDKNVHRQIRIQGISCYGVRIASSCFCLTIDNLYVDIVGKQKPVAPVCLGEESRSG